MTWSFFDNYTFLLDKTIISSDYTWIETDLSQHWFEFNKTIITLQEGNADAWSVGDFVNSDNGDVSFEIYDTDDELEDFHNLVYTIRVNEAI